MLETLLPGWNLIMPDLMGHGGSGRPDQGYDLDALADDLRLLLKELGKSPHIVIGHSLGAIMALKLATGAGTKPASLVLISGSARPRLDRCTILADWIRNIPHPVDPHDRFFDSWYETSANVPEAFLRRMRCEAASISARVWQLIFTALNDADLSEDVRHLALPVLTIAGSDDRLFDSSHQDLLRQLIPAGRHVTMQGVGHNPHWEAPGEVADHIAGFATLLPTRS
jgi:pimeloyl-ACP methyl ester carboxylesterase